MSRGEAAPAAGARIITAIVLLGLASATLAATHLELIQLWRVLTHPYCAGTPPHALSCAAGGTAGLAVLAVTFLAATGRPLPIWLGVAVVVAFGGSLYVMFTATPLQRSAPGANAKCIERMRELSAGLDEQLRLTGQVPGAPRVGAGDSPYFKRPFTRLPWHVERVPRTDAQPEAAEPGWLLFRADPDNLGYSLTCVGITEDGLPQLLRDQQKPVEFRGEYRPDTPR